VTANNKYFVTYKEAQWYVDYLTKQGYPLGYAEGDIIPGLVLDFVNKRYIK
jgi:hypothetical protein